MYIGIYILYIKVDGVIVMVFNIMVWVIDFDSNTFI